MNFPIERLSLNGNLFNLVDFDAHGGNIPTEIQDSPQRHRDTEKCEKM
jgi:hypothetical protein